MHRCVQASPADPRRCPCRRQLFARSHRSVPPLSWRASRGLLVPTWIPPPDRHFTRLVRESSGACSTSTAWRSCRPSATSWLSPQAPTGARFFATRPRAWSRWTSSRRASSGRQEVRVYPALIVIHQVGLMDDHARQCVDRAFPRLVFEDLPRMVMAGLPASFDAGAREVDVLGVVLAIEAGQQEPHQVHERAAAILREILPDRIVAQLRRQALGEFPHDVAQAMDLRLAGDVALAAAGELDVLMARHHLLD